MRVHLVLLFLTLVSDIRNPGRENLTNTHEASQMQLQEYQRAADFLWQTITHIDHLFKNIKQGNLNELQIQNINPENKSELINYLTELHKKHEILKVYISELDQKKIGESANGVRDETEIFLLRLSAELAQYSFLFNLAKLTSSNEYFRELMNEVYKELASDTDYNLLMAQVALPDRLIYFHSAMVDLEEIVESRKLSGSLHELAEYSKEKYRLVNQSMLFPINLISTGIQDYLTEIARESIYPLQVSVSEFASNFRLSFRNGYYITLSQLFGLKSMLEPGDILLQRREGYLSNLGIPGFFTHSAMYTGSLDELDEYFALESYKRFNGSISNYLKNNYPDVFIEKSKLNPDGYQQATVEATGEGVVLKPIEISGNADHMAALRPKLNKDDKLQAILYAFENFGKAYDYDFNFRTEQRLGCSELIYKAYQSTSAKHGLSYTLGEVAGRWMLTPNDIAMNFAANHNQENQQFDFIFFVSGDETTGVAEFKTVDDFLSILRK